MIRLRVMEVAKRLGIEDAAELSRRAGLSHDTAYRLWEGVIGGEKQGSRSVGVMTLHRVAQALGVKVADLIDEDRPSLAEASLNKPQPLGRAKAGYAAL